MLHLFHGDQTELSRKELTKLREQFKSYEIITLDGSTLSTTTFKQATESSSMFNKKKLVIVEKMLSKLDKKDKDKLAKILKDLSVDTELVFWEDKELSKTTVSMLPKNCDIAVFKPDKSIFEFVESIKPDNTIHTLNLYETSLSQETPEFIFVMLVRQIRLLIMSKELGKNISLSPWQASKFSRQSQNFTLTQLFSYYQQLLEIDVKIKTGSTPFNLKKEIELFLINI